MTGELAGRASPSAVVIGRRTLLGVALAAGVMITVGAGRARAGAGTDEPPAGEEYEIPDGIGSAPWW